MNNHAPRKYGWDTLSCILSRFQIPYPVSKAFCPVSVQPKIQNKYRNTDGRKTRFFPSVFTLLSGMHSCIAEQIYMQHAKHAISSFFIFISILFIFISNPLGMYFVFPLIFLLLYYYIFILYFLFHFSYIIMRIIFFMCIHLFAYKLISLFFSCFSCFVD